MTGQIATEGNIPPISSSTQPAVLGKGIERQFDVPFEAALALREKQIQQNYSRSLLCISGLLGGLEHCFGRFFYQSSSKDLCGKHFANRMT